MNTDEFTKALSAAEVKVAEGFWKDKMELARTKLIPYEWEALNDRIEGAVSSHSIMNFKIAGDITAQNETGAPRKKEDEEFQGMVFQDSDTAKWLEAAANTLLWQEDKELEATIDEVVDVICAAQQPDGYLNTYYIINGLEKRFTNLRDNHELYCLGHMLEAAITYVRATGKDKLLNAMIRYVDLIDSLFGPEPEKRKGYPGHEVIEMALVRLYRLTKDEKHLKLASYFIDQRGREPNFFKEEAEQFGNGPIWEETYFKLGYFQAHKPVREQKEAIGHAVRAMYLYCGMADVAKESKDDSLFEACRILWDNITTRQMYITGGVGSSSTGESFSYDYDLPNQTAYAETCAAIGLVFFAQRMLEIEPDSKYADVMERALFNSVLSGISLDGTRFFYLNPLESDPVACEKDEKCQRADATRQKWFGVACCPPNVARLLSSIGGYIYTVKQDTIYQNLYIGSSFTKEVNNTKVGFEVRTNYPWDQKVTVMVHTEIPIEFCYALRIPEWCRTFTLMVNGKELDCKTKNGYVYCRRTWSDQDRIELTLSMPVVVMRANNKVKENVGKCTIMRGPLVYCIEEEDNGKDLHCVTMKTDMEFSPVWEADVLGGIVAVYGQGKRRLDNTKALYCPAGEEEYDDITMKWIPYYTWANRSVGEMAVWIHSR